MGATSSFLRDPSLQCLCICPVGGQHFLETTLCSTDITFYALLQDITQQWLCLMLLRSQWGGKVGGALLSEGSNAPRAAAAHEGPGALNPSATKELKTSARMGTPDIWHHGSNKRNSKMFKMVPKERIQLTRKWTMLMFTYHPHRQQKQKLLKMVCQTKLFNVHNTWPCRCSEYKKFKNIRNPW